jgi:hypothetical protein
MVLNTPSSRGLQLVLGFALASSVAACGDVPTAAPLVLSPSSTSSFSAPRPPESPRFLQNTPTYPAIAVYIVFREYVNANPGMTHLNRDDRRYQAYLERRLRELYPERGYPGMVRDAVAEARYNAQVWRQYEQQRQAFLVGDSDIIANSCELQRIKDPECDGGGQTLPPPSYEDDPSWWGNEEFPVDETYIPTLQAEADSVQLTPQEWNGLQYYEHLALTEGDYRLLTIQGTLTRDDLIRMASAGVDPNGPTIQAWPAVVTVPLGIAAFFLPRIAFSWWRAVDAAGIYYPHLAGGDDQRDAFRHVYVNVMLRRYCTGPIAKMVMDANEIIGGNPWGSRVMDYHNNDLGREHRYNHFRGHWFSDRWNWMKWGQNVRRFIDDTSNGRFLTGLADPNLTQTSAQIIRSYAGPAQYIYFR